MKKGLTALGLIVLLLPMLTSCGPHNKGLKTDPRDSASLAYRKNIEDLENLNAEYRDIPDERIMENDGANTPLYAELKERYKDYLTQMKQEVEATGAKLVVMIIKPIERPGDGIMNFKAGRPFIISTCHDLGLDCYDFTASIDAQDAREITLLPRDGHWSKKGGQFFAGLFMPLVKKYMNHKSTATYKASERPETFGDLNANTDQFLDGGKDIPYRLKANAQGLRMDYDLRFPKTKPRMLFIGSSHIYYPFLDNEFIATSVLQKQMPEVEILNAGILSASIDDYVSLFKEKAKYAEPDVVFLQTNGGDIIHLFFSNRNHLSRTQKPRYPSKLEKAFVQQMYGQ